MTSLLNSKVQAQSLVDVVTERLEAAIVKGDLAPGSKLSEQALANSLGVSRGPLREAIRRLEGRRLLERTPNVGVRVVELTRKDFTDLLEVQEALQGLACALAAHNMDDKEIDELRKLVEPPDANEAVNKDSSYHEERDVDFHTRIVSGSKNERLAQMLVDDLFFLVRANRYRFFATTERVEVIDGEHSKILDAIVRRDPVAAEQAMRQHIASARRAVDAQFAAESEEGGAAAASPQHNTGESGQEADG